MNDEKKFRDWILPKKPARLMVLFAIAVGIFVTDCWRRRWSPDMEIKTEHYVVCSTATEGGSVKSFVSYIGAVDDVQRQWYEYLNEILKDY